MWIASDGNYLVRYTLVTTGAADYFGEGIEGTLTWDYELDDVNQPLTVEVPQDCPPGILDIPVMADATNVVRVPGFTSYSTSSGLEDVVAFYQEQVSASGAQLANPPEITDKMALLGYTQGDRPILIIASIDPDFGNTVVELQQMNDPAALAISAEVPDTAATPAPTGSANPSGNCAAGSNAVPILPDATDMVSMPGMISYSTLTSVADVVTFYKDQLSALGAQIISEPSPSDQMAMLNITQGGQTFSVTIFSEGGSTNVGIMGAMKPLAPASDCNAVSASRHTGGDGTCAGRYATGNSPLTIPLLPARSAPQGVSISAVVPEQISHAQARWQAVQALPSMGKPPEPMGKSGGGWAKASGYVPTWSMSREIAPVCRSYNRR